METDGAPSPLWNLNSSEYSVLIRLVLANDCLSSFGNIEAIMTTRISLIRSLRQKEQREQIGDLLSPFCSALLDLEKTCLLCLSERARDANEAQVSLNSVTRAQALEKIPSSSVAREFSNVLWLMKEPKLAIKSLAALVAPPSEGMPLDDVPSRLQKASLMAQLVSQRFSFPVESITNANAIGNLVRGSVDEETVSNCYRVLHSCSRHYLSG